MFYYSSLLDNEKKIYIALWYF